MSVGSLPIKGFLGVSAAEWPGKLSSVVWVGGCNLRCPFCQNPELLEPEGLPDLPLEWVLSKIFERRGFVEAVVVTGGEPTIHPGLPHFLRLVKGMGLLCGLETNGTKPEVLGRLLSEGLLDFVALDIKTSPERYEEATGRKCWQEVERSIDVLRRYKGRTEVEFRTTCVPGLVGREEVAEIASIVKGLSRLALQQFRPIPGTALGGVKPYPPSVLEELAEVARSKGAEVVVRGG